MDHIITIVFALIFSAFFSSSEKAFVSSNEFLIELNRKKYPKLSQVLDLFMRNSDTLRVTFLIGKSIAFVIFGLQVGQLLETTISEHIDFTLGIVVLQTIFAAVLIILAAEFLPELLFSSNPILVLNFVAIPLYVFYILFYPISLLIVKFGDFLSLQTQRTFVSNTDVSSEKELERNNNEHDDDVAKEVKLLKNALDFSKIKIRECIIPRTEICALEINEGYDALRKLFVETGYSKILIYKKSIDHIIGYVHVLDLFKKNKTLRNSIYPLSIVPETMTANKLLEIFTQEHRSIALVVDEFGGTAGIVTMEDILEEIFGEIDDEHDSSDLTEKQITENEYIFSGRIEIDYLNEKYDFSLPESDNYETLAGLILNHNESIPKNGEEIIIKNFVMKIKLASDNRIDLVDVTILDN